MQLKHLLDDRELTMAILSRWDYDEEHLGLLDQFRISANAVYPFRSGGKLRFLRFGPEDETSQRKIAAELALIDYLRASGYPANKPVASCAGRELECVDTPKGRYYAVVFEGVPGRQLDPETMTPDDYLGWGRALGWLHRLSIDYCPASGLRRNDWRADLDWTEGVLQGFPAENAARAEITMIRQALMSLPASRADYGLIHYDFETDNVFLDSATGTFSAIDFDDSVYHWFVMDVHQALDSAGDIAPACRTAFLDGYRSQTPLNDDLLARATLFGRFAKVRGYARILRSMANGPEGGEPDWMGRLRVRLADLAARRAAGFGKPL